MAKGSAAAPPARREGNGQAPAVKSASRELKAVLEQSKDRLMAALPKHLTPERVIQVVTTLHYRTPRLQQCDTMSILASVMRGAALGLDFEPALGEAWLIPRYNKEIRGLECQFQIGYQGLRKLACQSGAVTDIQAILVHEKDRFVYRYTPDLEFYHEPHLGPSKGAVVRVYSKAKLATGEWSLEVMDVDEIESIHHRSESYQYAQREKKPETGPWATDWNEMAKKTVIRRHSKSLPRSLELAQAIEEDEREYTADDVAVSRMPRGSRRDALAARIGASLPAPDPEFEEGTSGRVKTEAETKVSADPDDYGDAPQSREPGSDDA